MQIKKFILNLIYPPVCGFCNEINKEYLCDKCRNKLASIKLSKIDNYKDVPVYFDEHFYIFKYEKEIREYILNYKFDEKSYMYESYARILAEDKVFVKNFLDKYDYVISVPIHKRRFNQRGYNQSELIAKKVGMVCHKQYYDNVLVKTKNIVAQSSLDKLERVRNIKNVFSLGKNAELIKGKKVAIFDDVFTTGATVNECSKELKNAGARFVGIFTIAKS
ncbi:MAG: ComF family protein [Clostridia bacterium]|nr:ComF family protein [Clostridia bacterium]